VDPNNIYIPSEGTRQGLALKKGTYTDQTPYLLEKRETPWKVPRSGYCVSGYVHSTTHDRPVGVQSHTELAFFMLVDWRPEVERYQEQSPTVYWEEAGKPHSYRLDAVVQIRRSKELDASLQTCWVEIKRSDDLRHSWQKLRPRVCEALRSARNAGVLFKIITEKEIRLEEINTLRLFKEVLGDQINFDLLADIHVLLSGRRACIHDVVHGLSSKNWPAAMCRRQIWALISKGVLAVEPLLPVSMHSYVWMMREHPKYGLGLDIGRSLIDALTAGWEVRP
jgi:hypothetical protein